ncbi:MAG: acyl-ACP--UDP-N-acetylglucosamine O-acyltransferase [Puniceicoccales bacterium]|jgi:UDP-N-acetylglucosamine acyltransferase|nr:acyl-ACP--UDP-N-acetylglucosamine O-acyltransferase [Puniceicoccales bacterium]
MKIPPHPSAIVAPEAEVGEDVSIGPFAIIEPETRLGDRCQIAAHAIIKRGTRLGANVSVDHHAVVGGAPQDLGFDIATESGVEIGAGTSIREFATIHRASKSGHFTIVGANCYLMACSHVAHDCVLGEGVVVANTALLAGHVHVGDKAFVSGGVVVHQFVRLGESVMTSGNARLGMDVPPYVVALERNNVSGLNLVGLRRRGFSREVIADLKNCYRAVYQDGKFNFPANAAAALAAGLPQTSEGRNFLAFFTDGESSRRQFARPRSE